MKRIFTISTCLLLTLALLCGCGKKDTSSTSTETESATKVDGVTLVSYKEVDIDWDSDANTQLLNNALSETEASVNKITDRAVKNGDTANIDYTGYKNGIKFEGGEAQGYDLEIGSGSFIDGFEEGLIGVMPGETKNLNLTFPENYQSTDLAGQAVVFKVKVNYIAEKYYTEENKLTAKQSVFQNALINHIVENSKVDNLPQTQVATYIEKYRELYTQQATQYSFESLDDYIEAVGETKESFEKILKTTAENQVKSELVISAIAKKEKIKVEDSEYKESVKNYASTYSTTEEEFISANGEDFIKSVILQEKVGKFLVENSVCK